LSQIQNGLTALQVELEAMEDTLQQLKCNATTSDDIASVRMFERHICGIQRAANIIACADADRNMSLRVNLNQFVSQVLSDTL
jgi:hypothetical protein